MKIPFYEVKQANALTEARFSFSACEFDIYFYLLSIITDHDDPLKKYQIYLTHIKELTNREWNYQQLRISTKNLMGHVIEFQDIDDKGKKEYKQTSLLAAANYKEGTGYIEVEISQTIRPLLLDLKDRYTSCQLFSILAMTSKYAKRIYMICSQWKHNKINENVAVTKKFKVDELRYMLELSDPKGIEPEQYKQWGQFKENILDVAKNQINEYSELKINYVPSKLGRSFEYVQFSIKKNDSQQLIIDFNDESFQENIKVINFKLQLIQKYGLTDSQADIVSRRLDENFVKEVLLAVDKKIETGEVKNIGAYTVTAMYNKFGIRL